MPGTSNAVGRLLNWAVAHPTATGAIVGGTIGGIATGSGEGALIGAAGGAAIGTGIGLHQKNVANNIKIQGMENIERYTANAQESIDKIKDDLSKGVISERSARKQIAQIEKAHSGLVETTDSVVKKNVQKQPMYESRRKLADRQDSIRRANERYNITEARVPKKGATTSLDTSLPGDAEKAASKQTKVSYGIEKRKPNPGERTAGRSEKDFIQYYRQVGGGEKTYITSKQYGAARTSAINQNPKVKDNGTGFFSVFEDVAEATSAASEVAEDISKTAPLDASGIKGWISENPMLATGIAVGGGLLLGNILDDD